ncbi:MAG: 50S ribosomal protein L22 [Deltaproteobacteria bacterium]|nr:MAG: 50S ribosomal protein L22 [Deltaproteobacteria bacterium]
MSQFKAKISYLRVAPRKVRLVVDEVRGLPVQRAIDLLTFAKKASSVDISKLLRSAVANADKKGGVDVDNLYVKSISVDQGPIIRRFLARARGSASRINKKTSHITVVLEEK